MRYADRTGKETEWRRGVAAGGVIALPPTVYALLRSFPTLDGTIGAPTGHFVIVTAISALALALAVAVAWAARHLPDAHTFALAMGFLTMSGVFLAHGAGTGPFWHTDHAGHEISEEHVAGYGYGETNAYAPNAVPAPPGQHGDGAVNPSVVARGLAVGFSARLSLMLEARIIAVADVWDALTCDRPYRAALSYDKAAAIITAESGARLDARCVDALFAELNAGVWTELAAG